MRHYKHTLDNLITESLHCIVQFINKWVTMIILCTTNACTLAIQSMSYTSVSRDKMQCYTKRNHHQLSPLLARLVLFSPNGTGGGIGWTYLCM